MKVIPVTCAIIEQNGKILCAQRSEKMKHPLKWEFPGGKIEKDEGLLECLHREIKEELGVEIKILERLPSNKHRYADDKIIELIPFRCSLQTFEIDLKEHLKIEWASKSQLGKFDWAEADIPIIQYYTSIYIEK
ncbi:(deoxy)nucleoside triphosphate pyrophosphohydrolase [Autumnicola psychrophila]|uniref:8-oxo-dGTP diphosphatase n=1 Tax=Autumnicola psychrophila TaxID=3075592 RepID=A0ABU3DRV5_9FLAO|nr:(deoxy)nucleoside triphosphate pyrophosphohydrolase [Zunongwangia sp. F225]MDT0686436.1 (deoxy)nucleoside triphosphate pyrophosphohydrolase [Zunongwangia sp. F225]